MPETRSNALTLTATEAAYVVAALHCALTRQRMVFSTMEDWSATASIRDRLAAGLGLSRDLLRRFGIE